MDYATTGGTATAGSDYVAPNGALTFAAGETVKTVVVDLIDDGRAEGLERFKLNLSNASGATILDGQGGAVIGASDASRGADRASRCPTWSSARATVTSTSWLA